MGQTHCLNITCVLSLYSHLTKSHSRVIDVYKYSCELCQRSLNSHRQSGQIFISSVPALNITAGQYMINQSTFHKFFTNKKSDKSLYVKHIFLTDKSNRGDKCRNLCSDKSKGTHKCTQ